MQLTNDIIRGADVVFFLGARADPHATDGLTAPQPGASKIIHLDIDPTVINRNYHADVPLVGDLRATLVEIIAVLHAMALKRPDTERLRSISTMLDEYYSSQKDQTESNSMPIKPQRLVRSVSDLLRAKDIVVSDTGHMLCWTAQMLRLKGTGRVCLPCGGTLGSSFGEAIGAAFGAGKDQRVINLIGDGGFAYNLGELETLKRYSREIAPFVVVVNNNSSFAQSRSNYKDQVEKNRGWIKTTDFTDVDFAKVAEGFGLRGITVERASELDEALHGAFRSGAPTVVDVKTAKREYPVSRPYFPDRSRNIWQVAPMAAREEETALRARRPVSLLQLRARAGILGGSAVRQVRQAVQVEVGGHHGEHGETDGGGVHGACIHPERDHGCRTEHARSHGPVRREHGGRRRGPREAR